MTKKQIGFLKEAYTLQPHQERAIKRLSKTDKLLLYHGLGSGKTLTGLAAAEKLKKPLTVVGPASLKGTFPKERKKHKVKVEPSKIYTYHKPPKKGNGIVFFDEAHRMGRLESQRSKLTDIVKGKKTILSTGTPIRNYPHELIPLLRGLGIPAGRDVKAFQGAFIKEIKENPGMFARFFRGVKPGVKYEAKNLPVLRKALTKKVDYHMPKRLNYPGVSEENINVVMTPEQHAAYKMSLKGKPGLAYKIRKGMAPSKTEARQLNAFLTASRQISNIPGGFNLRATIKDAPKIIKAVEEIEKRVTADPNYRGVTYSNFLTHGIKPIAEELKKRGIPYGMFTGEQTDKEKLEVIKAYNEGRIKHLLISGAGGEGLDLKGTKLMQLMEPHWNKAVLKQVRGRAIRFKSHEHLPEEERNVHVQRFYAKPPEKGFWIFKNQPMGSDEYMKMLAQRKESLNKQFLNLLKEVGSQPINAKTAGFLKESAKRSFIDRIESLRSSPLRFIDNMWRGGKNLSRAFGATKEFAPGIPSERIVEPIDLKPGFTRMVLHEHKARKAGKHYDLRLQSGSKAHSWVIREFPKSYSGKTMAIQQPTHTVQYMNFEGKIETGYGAGKVSKAIDEEVDVTYADEKKIKFVSPTKGEFALIRIDPKNWILIKMKKFEGSISSKPKYKEKPIVNLNPNKPGTIWMPKIDGAHSIIELNPDEKYNRIYSYRKSKRTGLPIDHTHQLPKIRDLRIPKSLKGTILRTEVFARRKGKAIDPEEVSGILNSGLIKAREAQKGAPLVPMMFNVIKYKGKNVEDKPYTERLKILKEINLELPQLKIPEIADTPRKKRNLLLRISSGKHPDTDEGIVEFDLGGAKTTKAKIRPERDVWVRSINPSLRGFAYSNTKTGPVVGRVGTGFSKELWNEMKGNPNEYIGRVARIASQQQYTSGAYRAPSFKSWHVEKTLK
jgi:hypothetical protein